MEKFMGSFSSINADVFFLQEYAGSLKDQIEKNNRYHVATDSFKDKLIIAKKSTFNVKKVPTDILTAEELKALNWSEGVAIIIADSYIILNVHLSSKKEKFEPQLAQMKKSLLELKRKYVNYNFIVGGDINTFLGPDNHFEHEFGFYPMKETELTTIKKRTMTQGQFHKGNKIVAESKDKIISSLKILKGSVRYINNTEAQEKALIPTDQHPFDHFVLVVYLQRP
jgi:hypothetical protein